jgi:putative endonuclease
MNYFVYILECADKTLYIGSTNNLDKRLVAHNTLKTGARYTKARRPVTLKYFEDCRTKGDALKREWELKKLTRNEKLELIQADGIIKKNNSTVINHE